MPRIHPTAIVDARAELAENVQVGAYSIIKAHVTIGDGTIIHEHSHLHGATIVGRDCQIGPGVFVGLDPQHLLFKPSDENPTYLVIGDGVIVREGASVHRSIKPGVELATRVHDRAYIMGSAHVGHDCVIGEGAVIAQGALLGGHCLIGPRAFLGGGCAIHQFVRIGRLAVVGGNEAVAKDLPPFSATWDRRLKGYNAVGCRRAGLSRAAIVSIRAAYQQIHEHRSTNDAVAAIRRDVQQTPEVLEILEFIAGSKRGIQPSRADAAQSFESE